MVKCFKRLLRGLERIACGIVGFVLFLGVFIGLAINDKAREKGRWIKCKLRNWQPFYWL
jgi:hypothetical protein